ncbi:MAG: hypothetical protein RIT45_2045, partial [Pseudomonadota bacterium]
MSEPHPDAETTTATEVPLPGWVAERSLDAAETLAVLVAREAGFLGVGLKSVGCGWDNDVWEIEFPNVPHSRPVVPDSTSQAALDRSRDNDVWEIDFPDLPHSRPVAPDSTSQAALDRPRDNTVWQIEFPNAPHSRPPQSIRVPRRAIAADLPRYEAAVLPYVEAHVAAPADLRVPGGVRLLEPTEGDGFPWPILLVQPVPGEEVARLAVPDAARAAWAESLGRFLRRLHSIDAAMAEALGAPPDRLRRLEVRRYREASEQRLAQARAAGVPGLGEAGVLEAALGIDADACAGLRPRPTALCHGDLHLRHVLCDAETFALTGIIDWGDVHIGDPA